MCAKTAAASRRNAPPFAGFPIEMAGTIHLPDGVFRALNKLMSAEYF
jgi:hypothetical protein